jgi:adenine-specific DNA-methyltransferase
MEKKNLNLRKTKSGRYVWDENAIKVLESLIDPLGTAAEEEREDEAINKTLEKYGLTRSFINNRRYLGNKHSLTDFIRKTVDENCDDINIVVDIFSGTGAVANAFRDKMIITNDLLFSNFICNVAFFDPSPYSKKKIIRYIWEFNEVQTKENNYMRQNFADTFFSADDCSKIGYVREMIESEYRSEAINFKEYAILITSLLYGMDRIANTVGHYDAYRRDGTFDKELVLPVILPETDLNKNNRCYNMDANVLVQELECDLLYLDPPYNSRQYCDAYHLLENVASWEKPEVFGVARKMDRTPLKSAYCLSAATMAFSELINHSNARYILLSYNNMSNKGNERSNAKIADEDIIQILESKGRVTVFEQEYKSFSTGKSDIQNNIERLFLCEVKAPKIQRPLIACPINYTGGKYKLLPQLKPRFPETNVFLDLFAGGCNVGINSDASRVIFNDSNKDLVAVMEYFRRTDTQKILDTMDEIISRYGLSRSDYCGYEYYKCNSADGLASYNREQYLELRSDYNRIALNGDRDPALLYALIVFAFNNQIRFNKRGEFNLPVGKRDFNLRMRAKLVKFSEALKKKDVTFWNKDFRDVDLQTLPKSTFIYCDPPYLITTATYNEGGGWSESDELDLLNFLVKADQLGYKFGLSNVLSAKNQVNFLLEKWVRENGFRVHDLDQSYSNSNYQRKDRASRSQEVLITNY